MQVVQGGVQVPAQAAEQVRPLFHTVRPDWNVDSGQSRPFPRFWVRPTCRTIPPAVRLLSARTQVQNLRDRLVFARQTQDLTYSMGLAAR